MSTVRKHARLHGLGYDVVPLEYGGICPTGGRKHQQKVRLTRETPEKVVNGQSIGISCGELQKPKVNVVIPVGDEEPDGFFESPTTVRTARVFDRYSRLLPGERLTNFVKIGSLKIDARGHGFYAVAPPSFNSEKKFTNERKRGTVLVHDLPMIPVVPLPKKEIPPVVSMDGDPIRRARAYISMIKAASGHHGCGTTLRVVCKIRDFGCSKGEALLFLLECNQANSIPPWSVIQTNHKLNSVNGEQQ